MPGVNWRRDKVLFVVLTISAARLYNIGSQVMCLYLALTGHARFL